MEPKIAVFDREDKLLTVLSPPFYDDIMTEKHTTGYVTHEFSCPADKKLMEYIVAENQVVVPDPEGIFIPFVIKQVETQQGKEGLTMMVQSEIASMELLGKNLRLTDPVSMTAGNALMTILDGTRWQPGIVETTKEITYSIGSYMTAIAYLNKLRQDLEMEIRYRVTWKGSKITGRYVDLLQRRGEDRGLVFEYGHNVEGISRVEDSNDLATALIGVGAEDSETKKPITFADVVWGADKPTIKPAGQDWVSDPEAVARWGVIEHIYEEASDEEDAEKLLYRTWQALQYRKNPKMSYSIDPVLLEQIAGYENEKVRIGDTVRVKNTDFEPPLMISARVIELKRSQTDSTLNEASLGEFRQTISKSIVGLQEIQTRLAEQAKAYAETKASQAQSAAQAYAESKAQEAQQAAETADSKAVTAQNNLINHNNNPSPHGLPTYVKNTSTGLEVCSGSNLRCKFGKYGSGSDDYGSWVDAGYYLLRDKGMDMSLLQLPNLLTDHSFEMLRTTGTPDTTYRDYAINSNFGGWGRVGSPRMYSYMYDKAAGYSDYSFFGTNSVVVNASNYVKTGFYCKPNTKYFISGFVCLGYRNPTVGTPRIGIEFFDSNIEKFPPEDEVFISSSWQNFTPNTDRTFNWKRVGFAFTTPSNCDYATPIVKSNNANYVCWDGMQIVEGDKPVRYDPERTFFEHIGTNSPQLGLLGHIVESGSNSNGFYIKLSGGKQICWQSHTIGTVDFTTQTANAVYGGRTGQLTFPIQFLVPPVVFPNARGSGYVNSQVSAVSETTVFIRIWSNYSTSMTGVTRDYIAIGDGMWV